MWGHSGKNGNGYIAFAPDGDNRDGTFGSWTALYPKKIQAADHNAMALDPARDIIVVVESATNALYAINPAEPKREIVRLSSIGDQPIIIRGVGIRAQSRSAHLLLRKRWPANFFDCCTAGFFMAGTDWRCVALAKPFV